MKHTHSASHVLKVIATLAIMLSNAPIGVQPVLAAGAISLTAFGSAYTQDFDTLATTGTSSTVPAGWDFAETGTNANTTYTAGTGSSNTGDTYSFGATSSTERALGALLSGSLVSRIGAQFTNNTGGTITSLSISYAGEQWRLGQITAGRQPDRLDFQLSTDATSLTTGTWTDYNSLDFSSPVVTGTVGALNGNAAANRVSVSFSVPGLTIPNGGTFWLRWVDSDLAPGSDDGLGIDDFSVTPLGVPADAAPFVSSTDPPGNATDVFLTSNVVVTFSEPVNVTGNWFQLACPTSGTRNPADTAVTGGPTTFTINPNANFANSETCTLTVTAGAVADQDANDPPDTMTGDYTTSFTTFGPDNAPSVASTVPADGAINVPLNQNITVNFSEPVNLTDPWFSLSCATSGAHTAAVNGGPTSFTLNPYTDFMYGEACSLVIDASKVSDQDSNDPPDNMAINFTAGFGTEPDPCTLPYTPIYQIQGSGPAIAVAGTVDTQGVVVGDYEGASPALRGFFLQDAAGDADPATSDGIFVFEGSNANTVSLGDVIRVHGTASENQGQSQISVGTITKCGTGTVTPTDVTFPVASPDFLERYEGMLVRLPQTMYVTEHFQLGRFGQVVLSANARLKQPTNVVAPGAPALALQAQNDLDKIILDDASQTQNPDPILFARNGLPLSAANTLRGGDTAIGIVGVLNYTWAGNAASGNAYRVRPVNALGGSVNFVAANPRPVAAPVVGGNVKVVGMNLLNFFNTFADGNGATPGCFPSGTDADCRGANSASEFARQYAKTVAAITAMNPDVLGVNELENDGYGPDSALQFLADQLNAATAPGTYAFIDVDARTGQVNAMGTDAIRVAILYKPAVVTPVGQTSPLNTVAFVNGGDGAPRSRPSLAQAFQLTSNGAVFIVNLNHLKSKGSACDAPDAGDGQGNCNQVRVNAATELMNWFATDPTGTGDPDILMLGDYNSYAQEDPITAIKNAGFTNLIETLLGQDAYSYVFDGQWGYLDHALGSASIVAQVTAVGDYHINADEPSVLDYNVDFKSAGQIASLYAPDQFRISDHDPVVVGLNLNAPPTVDAGGPYAVNEGSNVTVTASGSDPDNDALTYAWDLDNNGSFETAGQSVSFSAAGLDGPSSKIIKVKVTDARGLSAVAQATVNVANVAPTVGAITAPVAPLAINTSMVAAAGFTDPGVLDTHTAVINWGDGAVTAGTVAEVAGSGSASGAHAYATPGIYTLVITVTDKDGGASTSTYQYVVVYDASAGFATGGGWIDAPTGSYAPDPALGGRASFGFVARYIKGQSVPSGNTEFQFKAGDLNFKSTSYEWLVVAGARAQFKGVGTINGAGIYNFMLTAVDGQVNGDGGIDKFRIKIWNTGGVMFDNQMGMADDGTPSTALGGGNIVVHK